MTLRWMTEKDDFHLAEPGCVHRQVHQRGIGPGRGHPGDRRLPGVGGAVVGGP